MKNQSENVAVIVKNIVKMGLHIKGNNPKNVALLKEARSAIRLHPHTYANCIPLLPKIDEILASSNA